MSKLGTAFAFLAGIGVGGGSVWYFLKARYEEISEQDIYSAKQAFRAREEKLHQELQRLREQAENPDKEEETPKTVLASANKSQDKGDINDYAQMVNRVRYSQTSVPPKPEHKVEAPYVISPEEFGELDGYTQISLTYFDDGILSDENGVIIEEPEEIVGDALNHFGEYEEDSVFVRSDPKRCDYEILRDLRSYAEFRTTLPPKI